MVQDQRRLTESFKGLAAQVIVAESRDQPDFGTDRGGMLRKVGWSPAESRAIGKEIPENFAVGNDNGQTGGLGAVPDFLAYSWRRIGRRIAFQGTQVPATSGRNTARAKCTTNI